MTEAPRTVRAASRPPRLTAAGGVILALGAGLFGAAIDVITGPGLRLVFAICFIAGCLAAAAMVRRHDLLATVVLPPLLYLLIALIAAGIEVAGSPGSWLSRETLEASTSLIVNAPTLIIATLLAAVVAGVRALGGRTHVSRPVPAARVPHSRA